MVKRREHKKVLESKYSSSSAEEEEEEETDSGSKTEQIQSTQVLPTEQQSDSSSEEEYHSGSESDGAQVGLKKNLIVKPADVPKKPDLDAGGRGSKGDTRRTPFQRLWSEDDELVILEGMIYYAEEKKVNPVSELGEFLEFIKGNLHVELVSKTQFQDKIQKLKKKYQNNKGRVLSKSHDQKIYQLSEQIWGEKKNGNAMDIPESSLARKRGMKRKNGNAMDIPESSLARKRGMERKNGESADDDLMVTTNLVRFRNRTSMEEEIMEMGNKLYEGKEKVKGTREWRQLIMEDLDLYEKKLNLMAVRARLVGDYLKSKYV